MPTPTRRFGTATLILTPKLIHRFGATFHVEPSLLSVNDLYQEAVRTSFRPVTKSKSVSDFEARTKKAIITYSKQYNEILYEYAAILGPSRFKLEYIKQIAAISKELSGLPFASLDLSELFRRHVACCTNAAANYEKLFESNTNKLYAVDLFLRTTNYGLTLLVLLLEGTLDGSLWIMGELRRLTSDALREMESMPEIHATSDRLSGSLVFVEGNLDLTPETRKQR
jgi:hypothetical protein